MGEVSGRLAGDGHPTGESPVEVGVGADGGREHQLPLRIPALDGGVARGQFGGGAERSDAIAGNEQRAILDEIGGIAQCG